MSYSRPFRYEESLHWWVLSSLNYACKYLCKAVWIGSRSALSFQFEQFGAISCHDQSKTVIVSLDSSDLCNCYIWWLQIRGMHTLIRDQETTKHDFVFYADRLIRLVRTASYTRVTIYSRKLFLHECTWHIERKTSFCKSICWKTSWNCFCVDSGTWAGSSAVHWKAGRYSNRYVLEIFSVDLYRCLSVHRMISSWCVSNRCAVCLVYSL